VRVMWDLWYGGHPEKRYGPYRKLVQDDLHDERDHPYLSKASLVMKKLVTLCPGSPSATQMSTKTPAELDALFSAAFMSLCGLIYPGRDAEWLDKRRVGDRSYLTVYDKVGKLQL